jgi:murein DD-endopeptidase MepM/ murein hydrolase activator NlpD
MFSDDFGAPRGDHSHTGIDIFSNDDATKEDVIGTPLVAVVDGPMTNADNKLGGTAVSIRGADGTGWYYAHLDHVEGALPRDVVAGEVIGYIGLTGSAAANPRYPHLHFEKHPNGGPAVDPYTDLRSAERISGTVEKTSGKLLLLSAGAALAVVGLFWAGLGAFPTPKRLRAVF